MPIDRRSLLALIGATGLASSACAQTPSPILPALWQDYRRRFITSDGRVVDTGNAHVSHSEGQGFGLMLALEAQDREGFEALFNWTEQYLRREDSGLYAWRYNPAQTPAVADPNNATDGDILIAWALMGASKLWRNRAYGERAKALCQAMLTEVCPVWGGHHLLLPGRIGFAKDTSMVLNPSYYVWPALDEFAKQDDRWAPIIRDGLNLIQAGTFGAWGLTTDWIEIDTDGLVTPAKDRPPRFGFDAVRVPLYLSWSGRSTLLAPYRRYWSETQKASGWPAWIDVTTGEVAPYLASDGMQAVAALTLDRPASSPIKPEDYYSQSLYLLAAQARAARGD